MKKINIKLPTEEEFAAMHAKYVQDVHEDKNCFTHWYPKVKDLVLTPKSRYHYLHPDDGMKLAETRSLDKKTVEKLDEWARETAGKFGQPLFMKTGNFSGKHSWQHTCFLGNVEDFMVHLANMIEMQLCVGCLQSSVVVLREFIPCEYHFTAFGGMPVTKEVRMFVRDGKVEFWHPYWPPHAIKDPSIENWEGLLKLANDIPEEDVNFLKSQTQFVGDQFPGEYWSVDWLKGKDGQWYLIDMALGDSSYKWGDYGRQ